MSDLRPDLEQLAQRWARMDCRVDLPENAQWGEGVAQGYSNAAADLLRTLAAHPAEPASDQQPSDAAIAVTREQIAQAIRDHDGYGCGCCGFYDFDSYEDRAEAMADKVLALINGSES
jgi:hypothetical protein